MSDDLGVLIRVQETKGSAPREAGTTMWVDDRGIQGTIGGGNLEFQAIDQARKLLADPTQTEVTQHYALGPLLEQCCGGSVVLKLTKMSRADRLSAMTSDRVLAPLFMFGAGHVGKAVITAIHKLPFQVTWIDERHHEFPDLLPKNVRKIHGGKTGEIIADAPRGSLYLVFTHSHQLDFEITAAVLRRGDARYCGLIGSKTKRARFVSRFSKEEGLSDSQIALLTCPIGIAGVHGKEPEVIAASVAAQLLQVVSSA